MKHLAPTLLIIALGGARHDQVFTLVGWRWLVLAGVFVLEVSGYSLHAQSVMDSVKPHYKEIFAVRAVLLPVCGSRVGSFRRECWAHVGTAAADLEKERPNLTTSEVLALEVAAEGLASQPGPLRDQHRSDFVAAVQIVREARTESPSIPDLGKADWMAGGK